MLSGMSSILHGELECQGMSATPVGDVDKDKDAEDPKWPTDGTLGCFDLYPRWIEETFRRETSRSLDEARYSKP